jgi:uncharacterized membrane protein (UPF0127 family)
MKDVMTRHRLRPQTILKVMMVILGSVMVQTSCSRSGHDQKGVAKISPKIVILHAPQRTLRLEVEVVQTPERRAKGLKYRKSLGAYKGMLFIFEKQEVQSFWMQDTYIPLDMIFIDRERKVVGVVENAEPLTTTSRAVGRPSLYVLEVNGGFSKIHHIGPGTRVSLENIEAR